MTLNLVIITEKECVDPIDTYNLTNVEVAAGTLFLVDDELVLPCKAGYEYNDSSIEKRTLCQRNETWNFTPFNCQGM